MIDYLPPTTNPAGNPYSYDRAMTALNAKPAGDPYSYARAMIALIWIYQINPTPALRDLLDQYGQLFKKVAIHSGDVSYFCDWSVKTANPRPFYWGHSARALAVWGITDHDPSCLALAERVGRALMAEPLSGSPRLNPRPSSRLTVATCGHVHSYVSGLMGMIYAAEAAHDARLMQYVRDSYEYIRNFGIARVGLLGEGCTTGDMTQLAIKLSEAGVGDYWEDVDCYVRNQLVEIQLTDPDLLRKATADMNGKFAENYKPEDRDYTDALNRLIGTFTDDATHLTKTPEISAVSTICARATSLRACIWPGRRL